MQRLALFDLDNTLVDRAEGLRRWAEEFVAERRLDIGDVEWMIEADGDGFVPKEAFFTRVRERFELQDSVEDLWARYRSRHPRLIPPFPGALDGLGRLRDAGWRTGVVTNGFADVQMSTLVCSGVGDVVDGWAISGAERVRKPDARLFAIAARRCGMTLSDGGWMIGDSASADIGGGQIIGLRTVWIDRGRPWPGELQQPDHIISEVTDAIELLLTS
ncbi:HAD family hydrolase [Streptosporangium sp. KLBMP 9127]|nr:HAD family hydrolase [Streptosporangium sp. KLBMP 9127]